MTCCYMQEEIPSAWTDNTLQKLAEKLKSLLPLVPASLPEGIMYYQSAYIHGSCCHGKQQG